MGIVTTVLGDVDSSELGHFQPHEHIYMISTKLLGDKNPWFQLNNFVWTVDELKAYKLAGGGAIMDPNPMGSGRYAIDMAEMSRQSGVHIVACTGFHIPGLFYSEDHWMMTASEDYLRELFISELNQGMYVGECWQPPKYRTDIRAGAVKVAISCGDGEKLDSKTLMLLRASAEAGIAAGAAVMMHTDCGYGAAEAIEFLLSLGLPPDRLIVCHVDRRKWDEHYYDSISEYGTWLEYDTVNQDFLNDQDWITGLILRMIDKGRADRMLISLDTMNDRLKSYGGKMGLDYILTDYMPRLKSLGVTKQQLHEIFVANPAKALERS